LKAECKAPCPKDSLLDVKLAEDAMNLELVDGFKLS
jgi:hypothetical protein